MQRVPMVARERITPEQAHAMLGFNTHNRNLRARIVEAYARDMAAGRWLDNGETIKVAADGTLLDGQHRLQAVVRADVPVDLLVVRGVSAQAQETMDAGTKRTFSDVLKLRGERNTTALGTVVRIVASYQRGGNTLMGATGGQAFTNAELLEVLDTYPWLRDASLLMTDLSKRARLPVQAGGLCFWLFNQIDAEDARVFFGRLLDGTNLEDGNPIHMLREALARRATAASRVEVQYWTAVTIKAWNKWRRGERIAHLRFSPGGAHPESWPVPE